MVVMMMAIVVMMTVVMMMAMMVIVRRGRIYKRIFFKKMDARNQKTSQERIGLHVSDRCMSARVCMCVFVCVDG